MKLKLQLPDTVFGLDSQLIAVFLPPVVLTIVLLFSIGMVITPRIDEFGVKMENIRKVEKETSALREKINYLNSMDQEELRKNSSYVNNSLLPEKNSYILVNLIRKIADKYSFNVDSFNISLGDLVGGTVKSKVEGISRLPINISLIGPEEKQLDLIKGLEVTLPVMSIDDFEAKAKGAGVSELVMTISSFYIEEAAQFGMDKLTLADLTLKPEETEVIKTLGMFTIWEDVNSIEGRFAGDKKYTRYERTNPFSL